MPKGQSNWEKTVKNIAIGAMLSAALLLTGCGEKPTEDTQGTVQPTQFQTEPITEPENAMTETLPQETIPEETITDGYKIETPIGILYYPNEWKDHLAVEVTTDNGLYQADFFADLGYEKVLIFSLLVGEQASGYELGQFTEENGGEKGVYIQISPDQGSENWSDEEETLVSVMKERINDILDQIYHLEGFRAASA